MIVTLTATLALTATFFVAGLIVRSQATGPKNKRMFHNSLTWFIFILQRRKI
jgi:hypothetical protein